MCSHNYSPRVVTACLNVVRGKKIIRQEDEMMEWTVMLSEPYDQISIDRFWC